MRRMRYRRHTFKQALTEVGDDDEDERKSENECRPVDFSLLLLSFNFHSRTFTYILD
jgi:hypothetical protein